MRTSQQQPWATHDVVAVVAVVAVKLITSGNRHSVAETVRGNPISMGAGEPLLSPLKEGPTP